MTGGIERSRRGQAFVEMMLGIVAVIILVSALAGFVYYIVDSLAVQNSIRSGSPKMSSKVRTNISIGGYTVRELHIKEPHGVTDRSIR